ncbi:acyl carrier protein [Telmatospirillum sp.]|uniref:acyl carrier protein n=1 Tax=Telmatospirillum sp. TaxID=2079197 RepID=UPI00284F7512|nr:acyl carrier protein [Telmatospirillum sp.]MDR3437452.1 acyl carrier protein [Telmatospirillum sp.]
MAFDRDISEVKNWMNMFRWVVKLIRDDYAVGEEKLTRGALIETDIGLTLEQTEEVMEIVSASFSIKFPPGTLDELVKFEEMCMLAAWLHGLYKRPEFLGDDYVSRASALNPRAQA